MSIYVNMREHEVSADTLKDQLKELPILIGDPGIIASKVKFISKAYTDGSQVPASIINIWRCDDPEKERCRISSDGKLAIYLHYDKEAVPTLDKIVAAILSSDIDEFHAMTVCLREIQPTSATSVRLSSAGFRSDRIFEVTDDIRSYGKLAPEINGVSIIYSTLVAHWVCYRHSDQRATKESADKLLKPSLDWAERVVNKYAKSGSIGYTERAGHTVARLLLLLCGQL